MMMASSKSPWKKSIKILPGHPFSYQGYHSHLSQLSFRTVIEKFSGARPWYIPPSHTGENESHETNQVISQGLFDASGSHEGSPNEFRAMLRQNPTGFSQGDNIAINSAKACATAVGGGERTRALAITLGAIQSFNGSKSEVKKISHNHSHPLKL